MVRSRPPGRLADIAAAGTRVFGRLGYTRTHMADVATAAGLSTGAVYGYVDSKEALFHLVVLYGFGGQLDQDDARLPLSAPAFEETLELIRVGLRRSASTPLLREALESEPPSDVRAELSAIVEERYRTIEQAWPVLAVIERSAIDLPALDELYFQRGRRGYLGQFTRYLERRAAGRQLHAMPDAAVAARIITEAVTWFAWHRHEDRDAALYDDERSRKTVTEFVCNALIGPGT